MTCKQVERILTENSSAVEEAGVQAHIRNCRRCDQLCRELQSMEKLSRLLGETVAENLLQARVTGADPLPGMGARDGGFDICLVLLFFNENPIITMIIKIITITTILIFNK